MDNGTYLVYLAEAGRNCATFAVVTIHHSAVSADTEVRAPSLVDPEIINAKIYNLDRGVSVISRWSQFYSWLGRGSGWAVFDPESAKELVPHWFSPGIEYECCRITAEGFGFIDRGVSDEVRLNELVGPSPEPGAGVELIQLLSNMVITKQPLFDLTT